ncbi:outer membrane beta-barrel protein [Aegicerativicinus sediminis]
MSRILIVLVVLISTVLELQAQRVNNRWKAQIGVGVNRPFWSGFEDGLYANDINGPTVNLGLQYMFSETLGAKLDYGFNRMKNADEVPNFKINYSRINAQVVYDPSNAIGFLPNRMRIVLHAGPGYSIVKPLGGLQTDQSYLNAMGGTEFHYGLSDSLSLFLDVAYVYGFTSLDDYNPTIEGLGAFNGDLLYATIGVSISLSGCYTCN